MNGSSVKPGAAAPSPSRSVEQLRFPCGHLEPRQAVEPRIRFRGAVAWVPCRRCGLIAVTIGHSGGER